jgi:hypothetical protein
MDSISKLRDLATQNNVSFEELCVYALGSAQGEDGAKKDDEGGGAENTATDNPEANKEDNAA